VHHKAYAKLTQVTVFGESCISAGLIEANDHCPRVLKEPSPSVGERGTARRPIEEMYSKIPFKRRDLTAEGRLADMKAFGGTPKMKGFRHGHEVAHLSYVDHLIPNRY
jgi:hypothetical protein